MKEEIKKIEISYKTIIFSVFLLVSLWLVYLIKDILLALFVSLILMLALNPAVSKLQSLKLPRWLAILIVYLFLVFLFIGGIVGVIPPLVEQTNSLVNLVINFSGKLQFLGFTPDKLQLQIRELGGLPTQIVKLALSVVSNIVAIFAILVVTFYLLVERQKLDQYVTVLFGAKGNGKAKRIVARLESKLGGWVRAQSFLMVFIGGLSYLGFRILGLKSALPLAILAGVFEIIPSIGPTVSALVASSIALIDSPVMGLLTLLWAFIIQQVENNFLVPKVMEKSVGVNPIITILSLAIGFKLAGVVGAILAIPVFLALQIVVSEFFSGKKVEAE